MNIGGLIKTSFIDYPGMISCVVFTQGCNFHCPYCHNPDLIPMARDHDELISEEDVFAFLETRKGLLDAVVVSGGEPTLQQDLHNFLLRVKSMGFKIKLDTNGSHPKVLQTLLDEKLVDYVAMDFKTGPHDYTPALWSRNNPAAIMSSAAILMNASCDYEFRTTCLKPYTDKKAVDEILACINGAKRYILQPFRSGRTLDPLLGITKNHINDEINLQKIKDHADYFVRECIIR